jgi:hypothetical protein
MKRVIHAVLISAAVLSFAPAVSYGQAKGSPGYLVGRDGMPIKQARTGECIRLARQWSQALETPDCRAASMKAGQSSGKR